MRIAIDILPDAFAELLGSGPELQSVIEGHHSLLLEGPPDWSEAVLRSLVPLLRGPISWTTSQMLLPAGECGTLVVRDVAALCPDDQTRLFDWLHHGGRRVISTTTRPLFPALAQSGFDEALYYRLNVIRVCAS